MAEHPEFPDHELPPQEAISIPDVLPVMALRDAVLFPYAIIPLTVGREISVLAVDEALSANRLVLVLTQQDPQVENPQPDELYQTGCVALIMRMLKLPTAPSEFSSRGCRARGLTTSPAPSHPLRPD
jgi:ATP-dependent Lon protease